MEEYTVAMSALDGSKILDSKTAKNVPSLAQLRIFLAVADLGSFTEAGLDLQMTQSAVSHAIASLEKNLNTKLFNRGRNGAELTTLGEKILIHAKNTFQSLEAIEQEIAFEQGELIGTLRIATFRSVAAHLLPPIIAWFKHQHPKANIVIHSMEGGVAWVEKSLLEKQVDVGITAIPILSNSIHHNIVKWNIAQDDFVILANKKQDQKVFEWQDLQTEQLLLGGDDCTHLFLEHCKKHGFDIKNHKCIADDSVALSMAEHGLGLAIRPRLATEPLPEKVTPHLLPIPLERTLGVATLSDSKDLPLVTEFVNSMRNKTLLSSSTAVQKGIVRLC